MFFDIQAVDNRAMSVPDTLVNPSSFDDGIHGVATERVVGFGEQEYWSVQAENQGQVDRSTVLQRRA
jgi:hypothetical protein